MGRPPADLASIALLEDDLGAPGLIQPGAGLMPLELDAGVPDAAVLCFFQDVLESLAAGILEEVIALGCTRVVACGGAGALRDELVLGHAVVVAEAVRDEGTSFHYLPPSRTVAADPGGVAVLEALLFERGVEFVTGKSWTTDAFYREARPRIDRRVAEGCLTVEMEAAAFMAVARFRGVRFAQLLYAGDSLAGETWEARGWNRAGTVREGLFTLALEAVGRL